MRVGNRPPRIGKTGSDDSSEDVAASKEIRIVTKRLAKILKSSRQSSRKKNRRFLVGQFDDIKDPFESGAHTPFRLSRIRKAESSRPTSTESPAAHSSRSERYEKRVQLALASLDQTLREAFLLKFVEGFSNLEIEQMLSITSRTLHRRIEVAKSRLAKQLRDSIHGVSVPRGYWRESLSSGLALEINPSAEQLGITILSVSALSAAESATRLSSATGHRQWLSDLAILPSYAVTYRCDVGRLSRACQQIQARETLPPVRIAFPQNLVLADAEVAACIVSYPSGAANGCPFQIVEGQKSIAVEMHDPLAVLDPALDGSEGDLVESSFFLTLLRDLNAARA